MDEDNDAFKARNWACYWSNATGMAAALAAPMIHPKLMELRRAIGGLAAKKSTEAYGPKFPVKSSKELFQKLGQSLADLNLLAYVVHQAPHHFEYAYTDNNGNARVGTGIHITATVRVAAEDGSFVDFVGSGHGMDKDDKAGGKASTYAWKDAILKGLTIPEKDLLDTDDEEGAGDARVAKKATPTARTISEPKAEISPDAAIAAETTVEGLKRLRDTVLTKLTGEEQDRVSPIYKARLAKIKEEAAQ